jgi:hypothetical protein
VVFVDQVGNLVVVDPERPRPLGAEGAAPRPPTIYLAATAAEMEAAADALIPILERELVGGRRQVELIEKVRELRERLAGFTAAPRLPRI